MCLFSVCASVVNMLSMCAEVVRTNVFPSGHLYLCASPYVEWGEKRKKREMLLRFYTPPPHHHHQHRPLPTSFTLLQQNPVRRLLKQSKKNPTESITLHCHGHVLFRPLHCFAPTDFWDSFGSFYQSIKEKKNKTKAVPAPITLQ